MECNSSTAKVIGAIILSAAVGAAAGILFAPDKGSNTRRKLAMKGDDINDAMKDKFDELLENVKKEVETVRRDTTDFIKKSAAKV